MKALKMVPWFGLILIAVGMVLAVTACEVSPDPALSTTQDALTCASACGPMPSNPGYAVGYIDIDGATYAAVRKEQWSELVHYMNALYDWRVCNGW